MSDLGKGHTRIGDEYPSIAGDPGMFSPYGVSGLHPGPAFVARRGGSLARSVRPWPNSVTQTGYLEVSTLERFNPVASASSPGWSTGRATQTRPAGGRCLAGPASAPIIGLGLSGSARRHGTARVAAPRRPPDSSPDRQWFQRRPREKRRSAYFESARA